MSTKLESKAFPALVEAAIHLTGARRVADLGCGGAVPPEGPPYYDAVLRALPKDSEYHCFDIDEEALVSHQKATGSDARVVHHLDLRNDWAKHEAKFFDLAITRCFFCLAYGGGAGAWVRFAQVCRVAKWVLSYDTLPSTLCAGTLEERLSKHGRLVWCGAPPLVDGVEDTRLFLLRTYPR